MICPKCDGGKLKKIQFKHTLATGFLCDCCGSLWFEKEDINELSGHSIRAYSNDEDVEYSIQGIDEADKESEPLLPIKYK